MVTIPSPDRLLRAPDADPGGDPSIAQAMAAADRAEARAVAARARAVRLSRQAEMAASDQLETADAFGATNIRPRRHTLAVASLLVLICAGLGASAYVVWYHRALAAEHHRADEFAAVARQSAITFMAIDADKAREDVQRIIDRSTGPLKAKMLLTADDLVKAVERSKVSTKIDVKAVSVESMTPNSAVVLVAANADAVGPDTEKPAPRHWRIVMTLQRDGSQLKMADVEMLP